MNIRYLIGAILASSISSTFAASHKPWQEPPERIDTTQLPAAKIANSPSWLPTKNQKAAAAQVDTSFGENGLATYGGTALNMSIMSGIKQRGGQLYFNIVGMQGNQRVVGAARFGMNGIVDTTYGSGGVLILPASGEPTRFYDAFPNSIALQNDNKLIASGYERASDPNVSFVQKPFHARLLATGQFDSSFIGGGIIKPEVTKNRYQVRDAVLNGEGRWLISSMLYQAQPDGSRTNIEHFLERRLSDGTLDGSFSGDGILPTASGVDNLFLTLDGKIVGSTGFVTAMGGVETKVYRFNSDGSPDNSFGGTGVVTISTGFTNDLSVSSTNQILLAGDADDHETAWLARLNADGQLDSTFGTQGIVAAADTGTLWDVILLANGHILVAGDTYFMTGQSADSKVFLSRLNGNGSVDTSFGPNGTLVVRNNSFFVENMFLQSDGKIVLPMMCDQNAVDSYACLTRVKSDGAQGSNLEPMSGGSMPLLSLLVTLVCVLRRYEKK